MIADFRADHKPLALYFGIPWVRTSPMLRGLPPRKKAGHSEHEQHSTRFIPQWTAYVHLSSGFSRRIINEPKTLAPIFQAATANLNPWTEAQVDTKNPERGPLLII